MVQKISFAIEDARVVENKNDSQFATLEIDTFASGPNKHEMFVSVDTLKKTANTILSKPVTWVYDKIFDDIGTHDKLAVPGGFVLENSPITYKELPDGRTMMTIIAKIWKKYSGELLSFFKRDGGEKPVSVEMEVFDSRELDNGLTELLDYCYSAITCLGDLITPAIPGAKATVLQFAVDYENDYQKEFSSYDDVDFNIPKEVKLNVEKGLQLCKQTGWNANSVAKSMGNHIIKNEKTTPEKIRLIAKTLKSSKFNSMKKMPPSNEYITFLLYGGEDGIDWSNKISEKLDALDKKHLSYFEKVTFPYDSLEDINPALKGIDPPITLGQANEISRQADAIGADKGGWGIAIKHFKDSHEVVDGHWVKKENDAKKEMAMEDKKENEVMEAPKIEMEVPEKEKEKEETPEEEKKESPEEEKKEQEGNTEEKMSLDAYLDVAATLAMLEDETEAYTKIKEEFAKPDSEKNFGAIMGAMYAKMCNMKEMCVKMADESKAYMAENEELKKFKADVEAKQFMYEVENTMKEIENSVDMPKDEFDALKEESKNFSLANVDAFKNLAKAKAFGFASKKETKDEVKKYGLPWGNKETNGKKSLWE